MGKLCYSTVTLLAPPPENGQALLFHCNALGEVSGLVYVAASADGYVVGEELQGDYFEDG